MSTKRKRSHVPLDKEALNGLASVKAELGMNWNQFGLALPLLRDDRTFWNDFKSRAKKKYKEIDKDTDEALRDLGF